jgi:hypothetical protein
VVAASQGGWADVQLDGVKWPRFEASCTDGGIDHFDASSQHGICGWHAMAASAYGTVWGCLVIRPVVMDLDHASAQRWPVIGLFGCTVQ